MTTTKTATEAPINRTSAGLRDALFDEIDAIRNGSGNPTRANAVAKLALTAVETVRMEMEVQKHLKSGAAGIPAAASLPMGAPLALGAQAAA